MKEHKSTWAGMSKAFCSNNILLVVQGILIGILTGLTVVLYRYCLTWAESFLFYIQAQIQGNALYIFFWFLALAGLALIVAQLLRVEPLAGGSGIPQIMQETKGELDSTWWRVLSAKLVGGTLCILGGLSLGRSGPSMQLGTMAAKGFVQIRKKAVAKKHTALQKNDLILLSCGAGAGLAAAFQVPLAGILFVMEEIHQSFNRTLLAAGMAATIAADITAKLFFGTAPIFSYETASLPLCWYWLLVPLGLLLGLAGACYNIVMLGAQSLFNSLKKIPMSLRLIAVFFISGVVGLFLPQVLGGGNAMVTLLEQGQPALTTLLLLLLVKFIFSGVSFGSGVPGGIFFPLLTLGSFLGAIYGSLATAWLPLDGALWTQFIILGMAGLFAGILRTPVTAIILVVEMTGSMTSLLDITIVSLLACITANLTGNPPIYVSLLERFVAGQKKRLTK